MHKIAITPGDPSGIGPDVCIDYAQQSHDFQIICIADPELLMARAQQLNKPLKLIEFQPEKSPQLCPPGQLFIHPVNLYDSVIPGQLNVKNAQYVLDTLDVAISGCLEKKFDALVTGPIHKGIINDSGISFTGHTEYLAEKTQTKKVVMMLASEQMRVALATTHLPLKDVSQAITQESLRQVIEIIHHDLSYKFGLQSPHILICGLNPHAGEDGHLGMEEIEVISPVIQQLQYAGMNLTGPLAADTLFNPRRLAQADAILTMYHDQGLPVLKYQSFGQGVNITLGLPIIRTSVDHGTALELAGTGKANSGSLAYAIQVARDMI